MSHDSTAAPEAAARKLSGRRRKEIVAVLLFSGGPIFESSIPLSVFGIDRQDAGVPRYRLLVCGGEEGPLRTTGGLELTAPHGLEAISRAGTVVVPAWRSITSPPPEEARVIHGASPAVESADPFAIYAVTGRKGCIERANFLRTELRVGSGERV